WLNFYDEVVHTQLINKGHFPTSQPTANANFGLAYAYDFDDLLNMSGLIALDIQDQYGNPAVSTSPAYQDPFEVIVLESLSGSTIPDISQDSYNFNVVVGAAPNGVAVSFLYYDSMGMQQTQIASTTTPTTLPTPVYVNSSQPFRIKFTFDTIDYIYDIN